MLILNFFIFYNYIAFVHCDARLSDIYLRISGIGRGYHIPYDNEVSWNYLKQTYSLGEINNNRIVVNKLRVPQNYNNKDAFIAKSYQFQRFSKYLNFYHLCSQLALRGHRGCLLRYRVRKDPRDQLRKECLLPRFHTLFAARKGTAVLCAHQPRAPNGGQKRNARFN